MDFIVLMDIIVLLSPSSVRPEDWDDEMDGDWEPALINNPACRSGALVTCHGMARTSLVTCHGMALVACHSSL